MIEGLKRIFYIARLGVEEYFLILRADDRGLLPCFSIEEGMNAKISIRGVFFEKYPGLVKEDDVGPTSPCHDNMRQHDCQKNGQNSRANSRKCSKMFEFDKKSALRAFYGRESVKEDG